MHTRDPRAKLGGWKALLLPWMLAVTAMAYLWAQPLESFQEPEAARIIFWHVPMAMLGLVWIWVGTCYGLRYLFGSGRGDPRWDTRALIANELGLLCTVLATASGAIFADVQWGVPWNWDPKQVSITVLILIFLAYFGLRASVADPQLRARLAAVYGVVGAVATPLLMYVIPNLPQIRQLHPPGNVITGGLDMKWRIIYVGSTLGFLMTTAWMFQLRLRVLELEAKLLRRREDAGEAEAPLVAMRRPV